MPRTDGTMLVRFTLRTMWVVPHEETSAAVTLVPKAVTVVVPDYNEVRARVMRSGSYRSHERLSDWYDALTPHGKLVSVDLTEVVLLEEVDELVDR